MPVFTNQFNTCEVIKYERVIKKYYPDPASLEIFNNEVRWYQRFCKRPGIPPRTPKLLEYSNNTLVLQYVGIPITKDMMILNFKNQLRQIACFLKSHHCQHCDITPANLLIFEATIFIIDFGWAVEIGENPYRKWRHVDKSVLNRIGEIYRAPDWPNDEYSLAKIYKNFSPVNNDKLFFYK